MNKLVLWEGNPRRTVVDTGINERVAPTKTHVLLNPVTVGAHFRKKHHVIAGAGGCGR